MKNLSKNFSFSTFWLSDFRTQADPHLSFIRFYIWISREIKIFWALVCVWCRIFDLRQLKNQKSYDICVLFEICGDLIEDDWHAISKSITKKYIFDWISTKCHIGCSVFNVCWMEDTTTMGGYWVFMQSIFILTMTTMWINKRCKNWSRMENHDNSELLNRWTWVLLRCSQAWMSSLNLQHS